MHKRLCEKVGLSGIISKREFNVTVLARTYHIPKKYWVVVLKEMEALGMIKDLGVKSNNNIKVLTPERDIDEELDDIYRQSGLF